MVRKGTSTCGGGLFLSPEQFPDVLNRRQDENYSRTHDANEKNPFKNSY
jgi:hypothetical protein